MRDGTTAGTDLTDHELERALLALVFTDGRNLDRLRKLAPEDLTDPILGAILAAALNVHADGRPVSLVTLKPRLEGMHIDDHTTGVDVLRGLTLGGQLPSIDEVAGRLRTLAIRRRLGEYLAQLASAAVDESQPMVALAQDALGQLNDYLSDAIGDVRATSFLFPEAAQEVLEWVERGQDPVEISTGLTALDNATNGWHRGEFAIIAGRPSMGKSAIALASMLRTARSGKGVLFFSLEMTQRQVVARALTDFAYTEPVIAYADVKPNRLNQNQIARLREAATAFDQLPIEVETKNGLTMADIWTRTRRAKEEFRERGWDLALVVVDHMLKIRPSSRYKGQPVKELDEVSEGMTVLAKSENLAVVGLHQLNRGVESRENQRPLMSDLRGSGSLEQDADVILFPYRPAYRFERQMQEAEGDANKRADAEAKLEVIKNEMEVQIAKQRNGPLATLNFWVDMQANIIRDVAHQNRGRE